MTILKPVNQFFVMRSNFLILFSLLFIWLGLVGVKLTTLNIFFACLAPALTFYITKKLSLIPKKTDLSFFKSIQYLCWLIKEIILSSIAVSKIIWRKNLAIIPSIAPIVSVQDTRLGAVIYANSITLTPGTVTLSLEDNKLLVHALDTGFMDGLQEGDMDRRVKGLV